MKEIRRISIADEVVENIKEMIENGEYSNGDRIPTEMELCEKMKVSRTSVREAIRVLQALGYVEIRPGKGTFVSNEKIHTDVVNWYDVADAQYFDFMEVRMALEELSVRLAIERATDRQICELEEIQTSFEDAVEKQDKLRLIMLDELFHTKIVQFTKNQLLININKQLVAAFRPYRSRTFMDSRYYARAKEPHARILFCFKMRNVEMAIEELHKHLEASAADMAVIYSESKKTGG